MKLKKLMLDSRLAEATGKALCVFTADFAFAGRVSSISGGVVTIDPAMFVGETGPFDTPTWGSAEALPYGVSMPIWSVRWWVILDKPAMLNRS